MSIYLTKSIAYNLTNQLCQKHKENCDKLEADFVAYITVRYNDSVPAEVRKFAATFGPYISFGCNIKIMIGSKSENFDIDANVILKGERAVLRLDATGRKLYHTQKNAEIEYRKLYNAVKAQILSLRTINCLKEQFPEAAALLNTSKSDEPKAINITLKAVREKLKA